MSIAQPPPEVLRATDWDELVKIELGAAALSNGGKLDRATFDELWARALKAAGGHKELLETLAMYRP
jgi:hypothetical protein